MYRIAAVLTVFAALFCLPANFAMAQSAPPSNAEQAEAVRAALAREFGTHLTPVARFAPMFGDFDGDGAEDLAVVVTGKPAIEQGEYDYKLIDPYDSYFGYGNAKLMMSFPSRVDGAALYVAIVHDWRAAKPKAKFVIVNLPFEQIEVTRTQFKKKKISALAVTDSTGIDAQVFWDGRKYRWIAVGGE